MNEMDTVSNSPNASSPSARPRVLVVDDVAENLHVLLGILRSEFAVMAATSGARALDIASRESAPDLILLDIRMPEMDGYEVLHRLKSNPRTQDIPVIFVTALAESADEAVGLRLGAADYVTKPVNAELLLLLRVRNQLELRQWRQQRRQRDIEAQARDLPRGHKPLLLLVDDAPENLQGLMSALQEDYRITVAQGGHKALDLLAAGPVPDLVLLDVVMPQMDGYEVCRRLKELPSCRHVPVIFITISDGSEAKVRGFELGAADYITKPFDIDEVRARIRHHLELSRLRGSLEDLVDRRMAALQEVNQALSDSKEKYRVLAEYSPNWEYWTAPDGTFLYVSPACRDVSGHAPVDFFADPGLMRRLVHPEDLPAWDAHVRQVRSGAAVHIAPFRIRARDGSVHWIEHVCQSVHGPDGSFLGTRGTHRDVTSRVLAEEQLRLVGTVFATTSDAVIITDADECIITVNQAFVELTGYVPAEVEGRDPAVALQFALAGPDAEPGSWGGVRRAPRWNGETVCRRSDGSRFIAWTSYSRVEHGTGSELRHVYLLADITEKKKADGLIWYQAHYDALTRLPNRMLFNQKLEQRMEHAQENGRMIGLLVIDLDRFKEVNDSQGHEIGDLLLTEAAARIVQCVGPGDTVARLGGDEFLVMLGDLPDTEAAGHSAEMIVDSLTHAFQIHHTEYLISASIGIAFYPQNGITVSEITKRADQAMYLAKRAGRGCFRFFTSELQEAADQRVRLIGDLRHAVERGQFELHYQPVIDLRSGAMHKAEALLRWQHPELGSISPADFIPVAEDTGLIRDIGEWVFRQVVRQAVALRERHGANFQVSFNVSPVQFLRGGGGFADWVRLIGDLSLAGSALVVEITEGLLLNSSPSIQDALLMFRDAGVGVAVDDFGTGYSSLAYLQKFDVDFLKIDQSFIRNVAHETTTEALCEAIVVMAHKLGLKVIAEGVETVEQAELLKRIGCDYAQGFLYSKALPVERFTAWAEDRAPAQGRAPALS